MNNLRTVLSASLALMAMSLAPTYAPAASTKSAMSGPAIAAGPGIAVGMKAPIALALRDSAGAPTSLARHMGAKGVVVVLVRSADWCPFCKAQLIGLNEVRAELAQQGFGLVSVSYDAPATLTGFAQSRKIAFPMLSDAGSKMIDALHLRDPQYKGMARIDGVPYASTLVLARDGTVRAKKLSSDYRVRQTNAELRTMVASVAR